MYISSNPLISVIIPTFNRCQFLRRAILSVLSQTYSNVEILVVSDGSTDDTAVTVGSIQDNRIKYFCHEKNRGPVATRNTGVKHSSGEFVTFLDDDDEWLPEKLFKQLEVFKSINTNLGLVFTNGYSEYENDDFIRGNKPSGIIYDPNRDHFFPLRILISPPTSWMLPRLTVDAIGYFNEKMRNHWDDGDYLVRVARRFPIYFLNEKLTIWHNVGIHLETVSPTLIKDKIIFFEENYAFMKKDKEYFYRFCRTLGKDAIAIDKNTARKYLFKALLIKPLDYFSIIGKILRC